ncbi:aspartic peptidase domain-containing protein [Xylariaceae sp. FL0255]|nr:aspartic peptidase domain-containing protein [Xylariaceae sp. FL0255]
MAFPRPEIFGCLLAVLGILATFGNAAAVAPQGNDHSLAVFGTTFEHSSMLFKETGQVLSVPLKRYDHSGVATPSLQRRFSKTDILAVYGAAYLAEITIGTSTNGKPQVVDVLIDTGSFELWVDPNCTNSNVPQFCQAFGSYDPSLSSTAQAVSGTGFDIAYGSGEAMGPYWKDDITISGATIEAQQFGVANSSDLVWFGIMGLGHGQGNGFINYPLVIDSLYNQGFTNTRLFSLDLGGQASPGAVITGEMVFGGIDTNKYAGNLQMVPTDPTDPHYKVKLNSLGMSPPGSTASTAFLDPNLPLEVILDSGTTLSQLPQSVVSKLAAQFPGAQSDGNGGYLVDCSFQNQNGTVDFEFLAGSSTVTINVAYRDFIWNSGGDCYLGAWYSSNLGVWILGDTFLSGAYVSFDQTNNAVFMSNYISCNGGASNLVPVPAGTNAAGNIPGACQSAASPASSSPGPSSSSSKSTTSPSSSATPTSASFPSGPVSSSVIQSAASSLGATLNPVGPVSSATPTSTLSSSSSSVMRSSTHVLPASSSPIGQPVGSPVGVSPSGTLSSPTVSISSTHPVLSGAASPTASSSPASAPFDNSTGTVTTVPLNNPTDIPPGAPAQGGPDSNGVGGANDIGEGPASAGDPSDPSDPPNSTDPADTSDPNEEDPDDCPADDGDDSDGEDPSDSTSPPSPTAPPNTANGNGNVNEAGDDNPTDPGLVVPGAVSAAEATTTTEATTTVTTTVTRAVLSTVTACPPGDPDPLCTPGQVSTQFETVVTTYCPEDEAISIGIGGITITAAAAEAQVTGPSVVAAPVGADAVTITTVMMQGGNSAAQTVEIQQQPVPTTTIYEVTSCNSADASCSIGMTTTSVVTMMETLRVEPVPVASGAAGGVIPANNQVAPGGGSGSGNGTVPTSPSPIISVPIAQATRGVVDDAILDRRYLWLAFVAVWGIMVML